jgi:acetyl-CoA acetyltransferase
MRQVKALLRRSVVVYRRSVRLATCLGVNDGAAALLLCSHRTALSKQQTPLARIVSWAQTGLDPLVMVGRVFIVDGLIVRTVCHTTGPGPNQIDRKSFA